MHLVSPGQDLHTSEMKTSKIQEMLDVNVYLKLGGIVTEEIWFDRLVNLNLPIK
jgi:ABC-type Zn uptake system ZnuABC Zn-binding protein ZnuA